MRKFAVRLFNIFTFVIMSMLGMTGYFGNGGVFKLGSTTVSELTSIVPAGYSADDIDTTTHNSSDRFRTFEKGLMDAGEVAIEGNFNYTDYATVLTAMVTNSLQSLTAVVPTGASKTTFAANGYIKSLDCDDPHDDKVSFSATAKISGKPVVTVA